MSGSLSNRVFALLCETTLFDKEVFAGMIIRALTQILADLKLLFNMMRKQILNLNCSRLVTKF